MKQRVLLLSAITLIVIALAAILISLIELVSVGETEKLYIYIVVISLILIIFGLQLFRIASRIHPAIKKHFIASLDVKGIRQKADSGEPFDLPIGTQTVTVQVEHERIFEKGAEIIEVFEDEQPQRRNMDEHITYSGRVVGDNEPTEVRLTITDNFLLGYVMHGSDWWFVEPLRTVLPDAEPSDYLFYRTKDLKFKLNLEDDVVPKIVEQVDPGSLPGGSGTLPPPPPPKHKVGPSIGIVLVADEELDKTAHWLGGKWHQYQIAVLHQVNGLYKKNLKIWFTPKVWILSYKGLKNTNAQKLLADLETIVKATWGDLRLKKIRKDKLAEVAHLTSGKCLDGKTLGVAWQPGVYGLSEHRLFWIGGGGGGGAPNLAFKNMMIMAHELGHNFYAVHEDADEWCVTHFLWCWDYERSLMWPTFYSDNNDWISDGSRNKNHNNRNRIAHNIANQRDHNF